MVTQPDPLATDDTNSIRLFEPVRESTGWIGRCGSITRDSDGTWYIAERLRTGDTDRGHYMRGHSNASTDLDTANWTQEWEVSNEDVSMQSFEDVSLRIFDSTFYLYICYDVPDDSGKDWTIAVVSASSFSELGTQLADTANWTDITGVSDKDPAVFEVDGEYYLFYQDNDSGLELPLIKSANPDFQSFTTVYNTFIQEYESTHKGQDDSNPGTMTYDPDSGNYLLWASINHKDDGEIYSIYAESDDLSSFSYANRELEVENATTQTGDFRYQDYHSTSDTGYVVIAEYSGMSMPTDEGTKNEHALYLWDYR